MIQTLDSTSQTICNQIPNQFTLANPNDLQQYILCLNNTSTLHECPHLMFYNNRTGFCETIKNCKFTKKKTVELVYKIPGSCNNLPNSYRQSIINACDVYEECQNGDLLQKSCPDGLYFNEKSGFCDKTSNVRCKEMCLNISNNFSIPHRMNSSKYWICNDGVPSLQMCASGLHFNYKTGFCQSPPLEMSPNVWSCVNGLKHNNRIQDITSCYSYYECNYGILRKEQCFAGRWFDVSSGLCILPKNTMCLVSMSKLCENIPSGYNTDDPQNSRKYIKCDEYFSTRQICPDKMIFNKNIGFCKFVSDVLDISPESFQRYGKILETNDFKSMMNEFDDNDSFEATTKITLIFPSTNPTVATSKLPSPPTATLPSILTPITERTFTLSDDLDEICTKHPHDYAIRLRNSCIKYAMCIYGEPHHLTCPSELVFNPKTGVCDFNDNHKCIDERTRESSSRSLNRENEETICSMLPHGTYLKHESSCSDYYYCHYGIPKQRSCPDDFVFNPNMGACDWIENYNCTAKYVFDVGKLVSVQNNFCTETLEVGTVTSNSSCDSYYLCVNDTKVLMQCPQELFYDRTRGICDFNVEC